MPTLSQSLHGHDLGQLLIIADLWGLELSAPNARQGRENLAGAILNVELAAEVAESLPAEAQTALIELLENRGRLPWSQFTRQYGQVREMGPGRRDRKKPHLNPVSTSEILWYRALLARAFFDTLGEPQEFAYIPDDLIPLLPFEVKPADIPLSRPAIPAERAKTYPAQDCVIDHACTLLAALRMGMDDESIEALAADWAIPPGVLKSLLLNARLLDKHGQPVAKKLQSFLEAPRPEALLFLFSAWRESSQHNDLRFIPHLQAEGEWLNDAKATRDLLLELLGGLDKKTWWSIPALIATIYRQYPDYGCDQML